jgi:hypothetical protein
MLNRPIETAIAALLALSPVCAASPEDIIKDLEQPSKTLRMEALHQCKRRLSLPEAAINAIRKRLETAESDECGRILIVLRLHANQSKEIQDEIQKCKARFADHYEIPRLSLNASEVITRRTDPKSDLAELDEYLAKLKSSTTLSDRMDTIGLMSRRYSLNWLNNPQFLTSLIDILERDENSNARAAAAGALGEVAISPKDQRGASGHNVIEALHAVMVADNFVFQAAACLGEFREDSTFALPELEKIFMDDRGAISNCAGQSLAAIAGPKAIPILVKGILTNKETTRVGGIYGLQFLNLIPEEALENLIEGLTWHDQVSNCVTARYFFLCAPYDERILDGLEKGLAIEKSFPRSKQDYYSIKNIEEAIAAIEKRKPAAKPDSSQAGEAPKEGADEAPK